MCGTIRTNYFFGGNHTLVYVREQTGYELPLFGSISYALKGGRKFVDVMNPNCRISVCHTFKQYDAECLHFTNGGRNSYTTVKMEKYVKGGHKGSANTFLLSKYSCVKFT